MCGSITEGERMIATSSFVCLIARVGDTDLTDIDQYPHTFFDAYTIADRLSFLNDAFDFVISCANVILF